MCVCLHVCMYVCMYAKPPFRTYAYKLGLRCVRVCMYACVSPVPPPLPFFVLNTCTHTLLCTNIVHTMHSPLHLFMCTYAHAHKITEYMRARTLVHIYILSYACNVFCYVCMYMCTYVSFTDKYVSYIYLRARLPETKYHHKIQLYARPTFSFGNTKRQASMYIHMHKYMHVHLSHT